MFTTSTPRRYSSAAPSTAFLAPTPRGGSSSTETQNLPLCSLRASSLRSATGTGSSPAAAWAGLSSVLSTATTGPRCTGEMERRKTRISLTMAGVVPQQPPMTPAPTCARRRAYSAMYSGPAR